MTFNNDDCHIEFSSSKLNEIIQKTAQDENLTIYAGDTVCLDCFDPYMPNLQKFLERMPKDFDPYSGEMEAFALFYNANFFNKNAACLMSVVDSKFIKDVATAEQRETGLNQMIKLALDSATKI